MRFTAVILSALLCLTAHAETASKSLDQDSDEAIVAAAEKLVGEGKPLKTEDVKAEPVNEASGVSATAAAADAAKPTDGTAGKKESEIPVFIKSEKVEKAQDSLLWRLFASLGLLVVVAGAMVFATKRYTRRKNTGGEKVRIEVLHRYQLSPKNSLALIRVAGEAILIGCTDQSVNMLKTVTLIDDELEGLLGKDFNGFLEDDFKIEDVRTALDSRA